MIRPNFVLLFASILILTNSAITVNQITGITSQNLVFSGLIPIEKSNNLFFTYYGVDGQLDKNSLQNYPLLVVVGNPGTSAQYYSLGGIGPMNLQNDMTLVQNPNRFTTESNLMFLDLLGSGFSFASNSSDLPTDAKTFGVQITQALNTFIKQSGFGQNSKIILAGQSTFIRSLQGLDDITNLKGIIHLAAWPQIYAMGRYYGVAGVQLKIYTESERIAIDSTFSSCYNYVRSAKYLQAHQCLDTIFNFVESRTKNVNLFDVKLASNLTQFLPMIQYYFSQSSTVTLWKAPSARLFESQSNYIANKTYVDNAKNYTKQLSQYMKDYFSVKHWFAQGLSDYISYYKAARNWIQTELSFVQRDAFAKAKLDDVVIDGKTVGYFKSVKQVAYTEIIGAGHHLLHDSPDVMKALFKSWLSTITDQRDIQLTVQ